MWFCLRPVMNLVFSGNSSGCAWYAEIAWYVKHLQFSFFLGVLAVSSIESILFSSPVAVSYCATVKRSSSAF